ncbi:MAG: hypothetical protein JNK11_16040 [Alphaproteobacteria bacterium]|nr:hypothetical protein [Alphaproteobacteria bacterium]
MSLAGQGIVAIWNGIKPEGRAQFYEWHGREHQPERVGIQGFKRGRRYVALRGTPEFFTLYETESPQVLTGTDYLTRLNNPTPWTKDTTGKYFTEVSRSLCTVLLSLGDAQGGLISTWRYDVPDAKAEAHRRWLMHDVLPKLADEMGVAGVHLAVADRAGSSIETTERKARTGSTGIPGWVVMVEGWGDDKDFMALCDKALPVDAFAAQGAERPIEAGTYRLQTSRSKTAFAPG